MVVRDLERLAVSSGNSAPRDTVETMSQSLEGEGVGIAALFFISPCKAEPAT